MGDGGNEVVVRETDAAIQVDYELQNSHDTSAPSISGTVQLYPDNQSGSFAVIASRDGFPAFESYQYVNGDARPLLRVPEETPLSLFPPKESQDYYFP